MSGGGGGSVTERLVWSARRALAAYHHQAFTRPGSAELAASMRQLQADLDEYDAQTRPLRNSEVAELERRLGKVKRGELCITGWPHEMAGGRCSVCGAEPPKEKP